MLWEQVLDRAKLLSERASGPESEFLLPLLDLQLRIQHRFQELLMGERQPLEPGPMMSALAFATKYHRELYPILETWPPFRERLARVRKASADDMLELLAAYFLDDRIPMAAKQHLDDEPFWRSLCHAFLQSAAPVMLLATPPRHAEPRRCPRCRHRPLARLDEKHACSMCLYA